MIKSMTGWGRAEFSSSGDTFSVEVKALNHRFLDIFVKYPERLSALELKVREEVKKRFSRGSFSLFFSTVESEAPAFRLNTAAARAYIEAAEALKKELGVTGEADVQFLLKTREVLSAERKGSDKDADWDAMKAALARAFDELERWRVREGESLKADFAARLSSLEGFLGTVEQRAPAVVEEYRNRLSAEVEKVLGEKADEPRLVLEAALYAERADVSEEITRLKSHIEAFRQYMEADEPVGKRLDFLCQELGREINTIGSKSQDIAITRTVVEMKGVLEKIREQAQNVE